MFSRIDPAYLEKFEEWMRARGNKDMSMSFQMRTLRAVFNRAIKTKVVAEEKPPFGDSYKASSIHETPSGR